ncbi:Protein kinase domain protein [Lacipirellula limnantheis]|uniref:Protein kinase domain protein n=2 Tax=Lacipirellula limnantheis TaxID=2528024 RepID=A0A517U1T4_9BACT|nr:Protein kinase domain protein [Lacipirellula limnantheis]
MKSGMLHEVIDSEGEKYLLDELLGKGGEGSVFAVHGKPALAAKVFHKNPPAPETVAKLQAMVASRNPGLDGIAAWPRALLYSSHTGEACGVLTPRVRDARHLHELYGTAARRRFFPQARWFHLVLAARNVAAAFDALHESGILIGDVNQGNLLIDETMRVRFIDCDSFQVRSGAQTYYCPVGTPHFTPPELHGVKLRDASRTQDHDRFGLAILLFHLLFVGRHPFAGRLFGDRDQTIERAIAERRFAFSKDRTATLMEPPPASLRLDDLPPAIEKLFERAFRQPDGVANRPTAQEWIQQLDALLAERKGCSFDPTHLYYSRLSQCPWCRIEDEGGPAFFVLDGSSSIISPQRIEHLEAQLYRLKFPAFPQLSPQSFKVPQAIAPKRLQSYGQPTVADLAAVAFAGSAVACLASPASPLALAVGALGSLASGAALMLNKSAIAKRQESGELADGLLAAQNDLNRKSRAITAAHAKRQASFDQATAELKTEVSHYRAADGQLKDVLALFRMTQLNRFLTNYLISEHASEIPGMTPALASVLQSYGVESPLDVTQMNLFAVPMLHDGLTLELFAWRDRVSRQFVFKPEHGVNFSDADAGGKAAVQRFKVTQARRILMASHHLDSLAAASRNQLERELTFFDRSADSARELAKNLRAAQSARRPLERIINQSPWMIAASTLAGPAAGALAYWLFG